MNSSSTHPHQGPRLPYFLHVKKFSSADQAFETPMESLLYKQVKGPLTRLLGGRFYSTRTLTHCGYTIGKYRAMGLGWEGGQSMQDPKSLFTANNS